jgi:hypothetical protein
MSAKSNAQSWLGIPLLANDLDITAELISGRRISISALNGRFRAIYKEAPNFPQLLLETEWLPNERAEPVKFAHLRARAWRLANDTARALGWFKDA